MLNFYYFIVGELFSRTLEPRRGWKTVGMGEAQWPE